MEDKATYSTCLACARNAAYQTAFCYHIGFGFGINHDKVLYWLKKCGRPISELEDEKLKVNLSGYYSSKVTKLHDEGYLAEHENPQFLNMKQRNDTKLLMLEYQLELENLRTAFDRSHPLVLEYQHYLAMTLVEIGELDEAEKLMQEVVAEYDILYKSEPAHPILLCSKSGLGAIYRGQGQNKEAESITRHVCEAELDNVEGRNMLHMERKKALASTMQALGQFDDAEMIQLELMEQVKCLVGPQDPFVIDLMSSLAQTYVDQRRYDDAETLQKQALAAVENTLGAKHPWILSIKTDIARAYTRNDLYEQAQDLFTQVLDSMDKKLGVEHPESLKIMEYLVGVYQYQDHLKEAEKLSLKMLKIVEKHHGREAPQTVSILSNLVSTYADQGKFKKAKNLQVEVVKIVTKLYKHGHENVLKELNELISIYIVRGRHRKAKILCKKTLQEYKILGEDHKDIIQTKAKLSDVYENQFKYKKAKSLRLQILNHYRQTLGSEDPLTLESITDLAGVMASLEKYKKAKTLYSEVLATCKKIYGDENIETARAMIGLASVCDYVKERPLKVTLDLQKQALAIFEHVLGPEHYESIDCSVVLANSHTTWGDFNEAERLQLRALRLTENTDDEVDLGQGLVIKTRMAVTYSGQNRFSKAKEILEEVVSYYRENDNLADEIALGAMDHLGETLGTLAQYDKQLDVWLEALEIHQGLLGTEDALLLPRMHNVMLGYKMLNRIDEAKQMALQIVQLTKQVHPNNESKIVIAEGFLGSIYTLEGDIDQAEKLVTRAVEFLMKKYGAEDGRTFAQLQFLNLIYTIQDKYKEAEEILKMMLNVENPPKDFDLHTTTIMSLLGSNYELQGRLDDAQNILKDVLRQDSEIYGQDHPFCKGTKDALARLDAKLIQKKNLSS